VHSHENRLRGRDVTHHQRRVLIDVDRRAVAVQLEHAVLRGHRRLGHPLDEPLALHAVADELVDADHLEAMLCRKALELRAAHHRSIHVHQLAKNACRLQTTEQAKVDRRLRVAGPHEDAPVGWDQVAWLRLRVGEHPYRSRPVRRRDAGGDAFARVNRDSEGSSVLRLVIPDHQRNPQLVQALAAQGYADDAACVAEHETDRFRRHELGRHCEIALVLTIIVVDDDHEVAAPELLDRLFDGGETVFLQRLLDASARVLADRLYFGEGRFDVWHGVPPG
jgi:hypothetical protein